MYKFIRDDHFLLRGISKVLAKTLYGPGGANILVTIIKIV
jgi:hypothetical protein